MNFTLKKSRYHKQTSKSGNEDNNPEEEELKKYRELIEKLGYTCHKSKSKDPSSPYSDSPMETSKMNLSSNIRRTTSRTKEAFKDRDFFINFMNEDSMPILPKNMHLLTDDDTNQNIDSKTKFQKLADLLLDDKETIIESHFLKKVEDKVILKLYTALSRRSRDVFMEKKSDNKDKNRILLHKLNNIKLPKFILKETDNNNDEDEKDSLDENEKNENDSENNNIVLKELIKNNPINNSSPNNIQSKNISNNNNINLNASKRISASKRNSSSKNPNEMYDIFFREKLHFNPDCKYNKKNSKLKIIKLPSLENIVPIKSNRYNTRKISKPYQQEKKQWEPDIDGDLLSYINHNIVKIEDIYNKGKENIFDLKENLEEEVKPIEAKEVFFDINQPENNNDENIENGENQNKSLNDNIQNKKSLSNLSDEDEAELKNKNKFCEYKDRLPNVIEISLLVEPDKKIESDFHKELQELYANRINEVGDLEEILFPSSGKDLKSNKIFRYAINNERNEEITTDCFTIFGGITDLSKSIKSKKSEEKKTESNLDNNDNDNNTKLKEISKNISSFSEKSSDIKENNQQKEEMSDSNKIQSEREKNNEAKSNFIYDDTNNLYSIEDDNKLNENQINTNEDNVVNPISTEHLKTENVYNNINAIINDNIKTENDNNIEIPENENNNNDDEHILKLSFSKISNN